MKACREVEQLRVVEANWIGGEVGEDSESCNRQEFFMAGGILVSRAIVTSVPSAETLACRWCKEACCSNVRTCICKNQIKFSLHSFHFHLSLFSLKVKGPRAARDHRGILRISDAGHTHNVLCANVSEDFHLEEADTKDVSLGE